MMERKEGEELDEIERQVEDLKIESIVNETASPMKQPDRTVDSIVNPDRAPPAGNPQEERKDVNYSVQWNNLPIPSGGQVNEAESPAYGNLMRGIGTFYYETNSVARNQTNSETVLQTVLARLYTN